MILEFYQRIDYDHLPRSGNIDFNFCTGKLFFSRISNFINFNKLIRKFMKNLFIKINKKKVKKIYSK